MLSLTFWIIMAVFGCIFAAFCLVARLLPSSPREDSGRILPILGSESDDAGHE